MAEPTFVVLSSDDFAQLVAGRSVRRGGEQPVELILSDIGFDTMRRLIEDAETRDLLDDAGAN